MITDDLATPFDHIDGDTAIAIARERFGLDVQYAQRFETERDDTFKVSGGDGAYALKLAHPSDAPEWIDFEIACVEHALAHDRTLPLARFLPVAGASWDTGTIDRAAVVAVGRDGTPTVERIARCAPWLHGVAVRSAPRTIAQITSIAIEQSRLAAALAGLEHPAADRVLAWDVQHLSDLRTKADAVPAATRATVVAILDAFDTVVAPALHELPRQVIHGDANLDNVLVAEHDAARVVAILDFGDASRSARIIDLAVAASYLLPVTPADPTANDVLTAVTSAAGSVAPLETLERDLLPLLTACRLAQRLILGSWLTAAAPENVDYVSRSLAITAGQLESMLPLIAPDLRGL